MSEHENVADHRRENTASPATIADLQSQIDELRKQVDRLTAQMKNVPTDSPEEQWPSLFPE